MHDPRLVRRLEPLGDLAADVRRLVDGQRPAREPRREVLPGDELHGDEARAPDLVDAVDVREVRMVQRRQRLRLALEAPQQLVGVGQLLGQDLDRYLALEARVPGAVDLAHPPGAEWAEDLVMDEGLSGGERHEDAKSLARSASAHSTRVLLDSRKLRNYL